MEAIREMIVKDNISKIEKAQAISGAKDSRLRNKSTDPEVAERQERRRFTADYKLRILAEADECGSTGEVGVLLRREGLCSSHLSRWSKKLRSGSLGALFPKKREPRYELRFPEGLLLRTRPYIFGGPLIRLSLTNRRVRTRTHGGVTGTAREGLPV
ncbi:MAG: helix-turn-helix domain-containing protein [Actinomycetota bacterium]|nr:helix-turn-helix domain-containing protein [Actinomycetota bacterium]